ncbi:MAG: hypothetical protein E7262_08900 [Lachnospiraceae bacterium]|nr:hypothetical protein [Lachnospiraceae bacterium]
MPGNKYKWIMLLLVMNMLLLVGCGSDNNDIAAKKVKDDKLYFMSENYECNLVKDGWYSGISIPFVTEKKVDIDNFKVVVDTKVVYTHEITEIQDEELAYDTYLAYKDFDWGKLCALEADNKKELECSEYYDSYKDEFEKNKKDFNQVYKYMVTVNFDMSNMFMDEKIEEIKVIYKEKEYVCKLDSVILSMNYDYKMDNNDNNAFSFRTAASAGQNCTPNKEGMLLTRDYEFVVEDDVKIKSLSVLGDDSISLVKVFVDNTTSNTSSEFKNDMPLKSGDEGAFRIYLKDERFKSKLSYYSIATIDCEYEFNSKLYHTYIPVQYNCFLNAYEMYAVCVDKKDILSYYTEYAYEKFNDIWW